MQPQVYKLFGLSMIGLGAVNLIALFTSLYNPLLGISLALPVGIGLLAWAALNLWQFLKTDDPEVRAESLSTLGETIYIFLLGVASTFLGVM